MKFCPMCGMSQLENGVSVCRYCDYEEKPLEALSAEQVQELMAPYHYEETDDGTLRILSVKSIRMRGSLAIPHFVSEIAAEAFASCTFLTRIDFPKTLRFIGAGAFANCRDLFDVFLPASVSHVGKGAFANCYDLSVVCCAAPAKPEGWDDGWLDGCDARVEWSCTDEDED